MSQFSSMSHPMQSNALPNRKRANPAGGSHARSVRSRVKFARPGGKFKAKPARPTARSIKALVSSVLDARLEHKHYTETELNFSVGQVNGQISGHNLFDIVYPGQGTGDGNRIGERIRLKKLDFNISYTQMSASGAQNDVNITHFIVGYFGSDPTSVIGDFLDANAFIQDANLDTDLIYDRCSMRNQDYLQNIKVLGSFKTLISKRSTLMGASDSPQQNKMDQFSVDIDKTISFAAGESILSSNLTIAVISIADYGNTNAGASTLVGIPQLTGNTGVRMYASYRVTFTDA